MIFFAAMTFLFSAAAFSMPSPLLGAVSLTAESVFGPITNSILLALIVCAVIVFFVRRAMKNAQLIPNDRQNFLELVAEFLYNQTEAIVGKKVAPRAFPLLATIFIFVLANNYFGLLPGIGTIGWVGGHDDHGASHPVAAEVATATGAADHAPSEAAKELGKDKEHKEHLIPWFRPASADLNFTLALAVVFMILWVYLTVREVGVWGFIVHTFGPKGGLQGFMKFALIPIFFFVGMIELVSIAFRPVSLSLRLFGNIFAGETLLHAMGGLLQSLGAPAGVAFLGKILLPLPFYFLELLVGVLQATVFTLLCAVYIQLSTAHDEEHGHGEEHHEGDGHEASASAAH
jgi:F-type H+-transporting ATPase subunit a